MIYSIYRAGRSGRSVWQRCSWDWRRGRAGSLFHAKNLDVVCDEELYK